MAEYSVSKSFKWQGVITDRVASVCRLFGLTIDRLAQRRFTHKCRLEIDPGDIIYITGPSGAGKTVLFKELEKAVPAADRVNLADIDIPSDIMLIDCIDADLMASLRFLAYAGLNDCYCILNQPNKLSAGEQYRFRLAMALAAGRRFIFADEFCCELDRITATVIASQLHRFAKKEGTTFVLASSHEDILLDLTPDVLVVKNSFGPAEVIYKHRR